MPQIFISYARDDGVGEALANDIYQQLFHENFDVFQDVEDIGAGDDWSEKLEGALINSDLMILVISQKVHKSSWVKNEFSTACARKIPVIPVLSENIPMPIWIMHLQALDFSTEKNFDALLQDVLKKTGGRAPTIKHLSFILKYTENLNITFKKKVCSWKVGLIRSEVIAIFGVIFTALGAFFTMYSAMPEWFGKGNDNKKSEQVDTKDISAVVDSEKIIEDISGYVRDFKFDGGVYRAKIKLSLSGVVTETNEIGYFSFPKSRQYSKKEKIIVTLPDGRALDQISVEKLILELNREIYVELHR